MNKIVLITGATSGIGLSCAHKFAENGDTVRLKQTQNHKNRIMRILHMRI